MAARAVPGHHRTCHVDVEGRFFPCKKADGVEGVVEEVACIEPVLREAVVGANEGDTAVK